MMEPGLAQRAQDNRQARLARWRRSRQNEQEALYQARPRLRELDESLRELRVRLCLQAAGGQGPDEGERAALETLQAERDALLRAHAPDFSPDTPLCAECGDTGMRDNAPCRCVLEQYIPLQRARLRERVDIDSQCFARFNIKLYRDTAAEDERAAPRQLMAAACSAGKKYAEAFGKHHRNLLICGHVGTGKTFLASCILGAVTDLGHWTEYITAIRFLEAAENAHFRRDSDEPQLAERLRRCELLVLDDLGTEFLSPFAQSALYDLINERAQRRLCTIITSNLTYDQLGDRYHPQTASRLKGLYERLYLFGEDLRLER